MKRYILFFDIDGTLIDVPNGLNQPTKALKEAISSLQKQGHLCFVSTGRTYAYLNPDILDLNFSGFVTCNGAIILKDDKVIGSHCFTSEIKREIVDYMDIHKQSYTICGPKYAYTQKHFTDIFDTFQKYDVPMENVCTEFDLDKIDCAKFEITAKNDEIANYIRSLKKYDLEIVEYVGHNIFEFGMPHITKGKAILELCELLNIPVQDTIAFGDGDNDLEMFKNVGHAVCMGNGTEAAKQAADVITKTCVEDGIVVELQRLGLI